MQVSFSPKQEFLSRLHFWWIVFVLAIIGASIGWGVSTMIKPQYEADAVLSLAVDFSKIGMPTDIEQDQIIEMVGDICKSDLVISQVLAQYPQFTTDGFTQIASIERRNMQWVMKIRWTDAQLAGEIAAAWQETAYREIMEAYQHAILVDAYANEINSLTRCIEHTVPQQPESALCSETNVDILQAEIQDVANKMKEEQQLSYGISPAISISELAPVEQSYRPVYGLKSLFILAGGGIGMVIGVMLMFSLPTRTRIKETE